LFPRTKDRLLFASMAAGSAFILLLPTYPRWPSMIQWFSSLALHSGVYGSGPVGMPPAVTLIQNGTALVAAEPFLFVYLAIYCGLLLLAVRRADNLGLTSLPPLLIAGCGATILQVLMATKYGEPRYMVPILTMPALLNSAICARALS